MAKLIFPPCKNMELLSGERRLKLETHRAELRSYINLRDSILLDVLMDNECICDIDRQAILEGEYEGEQTDKLFSLLLRRTNHHYTLFCDALIATEQSHIVLHYLTTADDIENVRQKLTDLYTRDAQIEFYTADGHKYSQSIDKLYTAMSWSEKRIGSAKVKEVQIESENQILQELQTGCQRLIIEGPVGSGKSTFAKKLCLDWCKAVKPCSLNENESVVNFRVVINISTRYVGLQDDLRTTLSFQMPFLSQLEILAVLHLVQNDPRSVLFILDDVDEGKDSLLVRTITTGAAPYIVITKSHYAPKLDTSLYKIFKLLGFNELQIHQFIKDYFDAEKEGFCNKEDLTDLLFNERKEMLPFAKTPIYTRMICVVYDIYKDLGENICDIFQQFINNLFNHFKQKINMTRSISNSEILLKLGHLALNLSIRLGCQNFSKEMMDEYLGCDTEMVVALGFVQTVDPINVLETGTWKFTYPGFQNYFMAYYLANSQELNVLEDLCSNVSFETLFASLELVIRFLCYLNQEKAITILEKLMKKKEVSSYMNQVIEMFEPLRSADVSNHQPSKLKIDTSILKPSCLSLCHKFFIFDNTQTDNLTIGNMDDILNYNTHFLSQVTSLTISIHDDTNVSTFLKDKHLKGLKKICNVKQLCIDAETEMMEHILMHIPNDKINTVKLKGRSLNARVASCLSKFPIIRKLFITDLNGKVADYEMGKFCAYVLSCKQLQEFHMAASSIHKAYADISEKVEVNLKIKQFDTRQIKCFWEHLDSKENESKFKCLQISGKKLSTLEKPGVLYYLGLTFTNMPELHTLTLQDHILEAKGLLQFYKSAKFTQQFKQIRNLKNLNLCRNQLDGAGHLLGELLNSLMTLETLDLSRCGLGNEDMIAFANSTRKTKLKKLNLSSNDLYKVTGLQLLLTKLEYLNTLHLCRCFTKYSNEGSITSMFSKITEKLQHLYLSKNLISSKDFQDISQKMGLFSSLKSLVLSKCWCSDAKSAFNVFHQSPPSLVHIDLSCNVFSLENFADCVSSTQAPSYKCQNLAMMNIGNSENHKYLNLIQNSLQSHLKINHIQVYYKPKEHSCISQRINDTEYT